MSARAVAALLAVGAVAVTSGCHALRGREAAVPAANPDGLLPGLPTGGTRADRDTAARLIRRLPVARRGPKTGYSRERYGQEWTDSVQGVPLSGNGCGTRDDMLARDGKAIEYAKGSRCVVQAMSLRDPYTGRTVKWSRARSGEVQVDHVVPLSYAWRMGAARWPEAKRLRFANDPLNLLPVDGRANADKGGRGPAAWLPPWRHVRCAYVTRFAQVTVKYGLPVSRRDRAVMLAQCR
ncbi:HNH endonuclease family protein [Spongiactinospora sp. TRM90649]|uniref:HNH endonuclease family protein n=1 Tax=Spongiactinospora sp. TRM90649 TaxID=3031114 RepID=UPI0023F97885|nr:HNH endonuclease family protein [Spongiactinospora sp. TRM90649]MDF5757095.1 HNH endonuclease family protein [Spongiactinospora sp. TRM90649]